MYLSLSPFSLFFAASFCPLTIVVQIVFDRNPLEDESVVVIDVCACLDHTVTVVLLLFFLFACFVFVLLGFLFLNFVLLRSCSTFMPLYAFAYVDHGLPSFYPHE